jgi:aspartate aminotransferase
VREYPYWDPLKKILNIEGLLQSFSDAPSKSIMLLHPCAHNPTGVDPTIDQWMRIAEVIKVLVDLLKRKNHIVFFDCAYQGFASGDLEQDAAAIRYFVEQGFEMLVAQSYAKNFGLYNERIGCLNVVCKTDQGAERVSSNLKKLIRSNISNPPAFGARIVSSVLNSPEWNQQWFERV